MSDKYKAKFYFVAISKDDDGEYSWKQLDAEMAMDLAKTTPIFQRMDKIADEAFV